MNQTGATVEMLSPVEDVGGAAQPLLQVNGLTKHFPVRGELFAQVQPDPTLANVEAGLALLRSAVATASWPSAAAAASMRPRPLRS